jgi:hypothetical protein
MPTAARSSSTSSSLRCKRVALGRSLDLDETSGVVHDDVHVRFRFGVLGVVEIEHGLAAKMPTDTARDLTVDGTARDLAALDEPRHASANAT